MKGDAPIACSLSPDRLRCEAHELLPGLTKRAASTTWTDDGIRLRFAATTENANDIIRTIDRERTCCAFLTFQLLIPAAGADFELAISGPSGTKEFLRELGLLTTS